MAGDGGLSMLLGELVTLKQYELPVKIVLFDNTTLAMVRLAMLVEGLPSVATDSPKIDYAAVASAMGIHAVRVEKPTDVQAALRDALAQPAPRSSTWSPTRARWLCHRRSPASRSPGSRPR